MNPKEQFIFNAVPADGEIAYEVLYNTLQATEEGRQALTAFHRMRRSGAISVRLEGGALFVSRPVEG